MPKDGSGFADDPAEGNKCQVIGDQTRGAFPPEDKTGCCRKSDEQAGWLGNGLEPERRTDVGFVDGDGIGKRHVLAEAKLGGANEKPSAAAGM